MVYQECKEALRIDPHYQGAHFVLGFAHMIQGNPKEAVKSFKSQLAYEPNHIRANYYLGGQLYLMVPLSPAQLKAQLVGQGDKQGAAVAFETVSLSM